MHIQELRLQTQRLEQQKDFYTRVLGLPLQAGTPVSFAVQAGTTRLHFQQAEQEALYHIAFTIPQHAYIEVKDLLRRRVSLLEKNGEDEIYFTNLHARSFYFCDANSNILECIVHYNLDHGDDEGTGPAHVLHVSEIGLVVEDVPGQAAVLKERLNIGPYGGSVTENFAFLGDIYGQLVMVKAGRPWLPTETVLATVAPVEVTISGQGAQQVQLTPLPYIIRTSGS